MFGFFKRRRREKLRNLPFPDKWLAVLQQSVPYYRRLSEDDQKELQGHIHIFLAEKSFEGCGGLELTEEMKLIVAAQACVLLLHRDTDYYPELDSILIYPSAFRAGGGMKAGGVVMEASSDVRLGESWSRGLIVLAWDSVLSGAKDVRDGHNVVFHEFAHQLDQQDGAADGAPELERSSMYGTWAKVLAEDFEQLVEDADRARRSMVIDAYGATNPAEFFAVVTETFFEKPWQLKSKHPALYEQMSQFYKQDPATRPRS